MHSADGPLRFWGCVFLCIATTCSAQATDPKPTRPQMPAVDYPAYASQFGITGPVICRIQCSPSEGVPAGGVVIEQSAPAGVFDQAVIEAASRLQCPSCEKAMCTYRLPNVFTMDSP